jgi:polyhydroxyalkanoate synthesis repressor PhaR
VEGREHMTSSKETNSSNDETKKRDQDKDQEKQKHKKATVIRKYANRRLYHTGTSTYVTLDDLSVMVRKGEDFIVHDAKSGDDITRSVLGQIIMEEENKSGQSLLPTPFLRQLISLYGDSMQNLVPKYLEYSIQALMSEQKALREKMAQTVTETVSQTMQQALIKTPFGENPFGAAAFKVLEEQTKTNMASYAKAFEMFNPLHVLEQATSALNTPTSVEPKTQDTSSLEALKKQIADMQARLDKMDS